MGLQALTTSINPTSLAAVQAHLRIVDDSDNATLLVFMQAAFEYVETETRQQFCTRQYLLTYDGFPGEHSFPYCHHGISERSRHQRAITLPKPPLRSVDGIAYTDGSGNPQTFDAANYTVDTTQMPGRIVLKPGKSWPQTDGSANCVGITFTCGHYSDETLPMILQQAILLLCGHWYENREGAIDRRIDSIPLGVQSIIEQNMYPTAQG